MHRSRRVGLAALAFTVGLALAACSSASTSASRSTSRDVVRMVSAKQIKFVHRDFPAQAFSASFPSANFGSSSLTCNTGGGEGGACYLRAKTGFSAGSVLYMADPNVWRYCSETTQEWQYNLGYNAEACTSPSHFAVEVYDIPAAHQSDAMDLAVAYGQCVDVWTVTVGGVKGKGCGPWENTPSLFVIHHGRLYVITAGELLPGDPTARTFLRSIKFT